MAYPGSSASVSHKTKIKLLTRAEISSEGSVKWISAFNSTHMLLASFSSSRLLHKGFSFSLFVSWRTPTVPCYYSFSIRQVTKWQLTSTWVNKQRTKGEQDGSHSLFVTQSWRANYTSILSYSICEKRITRSSSYPYTKGRHYTKAWITGSRHHWEPSSRLLTKPHLHPSHWF